jgi:hypothetical protein
MRTDYILYIVAVICFIIAAYGAAYPYATSMANTAIVIVLAIIGIIFIWGGYSLRPSRPVVKRTEPVVPPTKPALEKEQPAVVPSSSTPETEPEPVPTPEPTPVPEPEKTEETSQPETTPPETKPVRKRRERKKA